MTERDRSRRSRSRCPRRSRASATRGSRTAANASLISTRPRSPTSSPARFSAASIASAGTVCSDEYAPGRHAVGLDLRRSAGAPSRAAASSLATTTAAAPSEICDALPAVTVPSAVNAGVERGQRLQAGVGPDPFVPIEDHGIALALRHLDRPRPPRPAARRPTPRPRARCERADHASCSARSMPSSPTDDVGPLTHVVIVEARPQAVVDHRVERSRRRPAAIRRAPSGAGTARSSWTPCRPPPRSRARPRGSSGRPSRSRRARTGRPC